jgi:hypothetical protein
MIRLVRLLAAAIPTATTQTIEGAGHAAPFDATDKLRARDREFALSLGRSGRSMR